MISALVVDDERLARRKLRDLIARVEWLVYVGEAVDGEAAMAEIERLKPDLLLLDIEMPGLSGVQVLERLQEGESTPVVIFTTAYDRYAVTAFELGAVDYLLKPFGAVRFLKALDRARPLIDAQQGTVSVKRASEAIERTSGKLPLERIFVRARGSILPICLSKIHHIEAQVDYVMLYVEGHGYLVNLRMNQLETELPNPPFLRVHRSHIVNLDYVERIDTIENSRLEVRMTDGAVVPVSRVRAQDIRSMLH
jgi:two-component system LytT family response regulator